MSEIKNKSVLFISPHTDDVELSAGATLARYIREGANVFYLALTATDNRKQLKKEAAKSMGVFGLKKNSYEFLDFRDMYFPEQRREMMLVLEKYRDVLKPDAVFCPSRNDIHQDHQETTMCTLRVFKWRSDIYGYDISWNMVTTGFSPNYYVEVSSDDLIMKMDAMKCYESQIGKFYTKEETLQGRARSTGVQVGVEFAESFESYRRVDKL